MEENDGGTPDHDQDSIDASAWQMWVVVLKTCGPWVALRTAARYGWMVLKGET